MGDCCQGGAQWPKRRLGTLPSSEFIQSRKQWVSWAWGFGRQSLQPGASIFLNIPSEPGWGDVSLAFPLTQLRSSEGKTESAFVLAVEEHQFRISTRLVPAEARLTNTVKLEQNFPQVCGGRPGPGQPGRLLGQPSEKRGVVLAPRGTQCRRAGKWAKVAGMASQLALLFFLPLFIERLGATPGAIPAARILPRTGLIVLVPTKCTRQ